MSPNRTLLLRHVSTARGLILDAIFPPRCAGCRTWSRDLFCSACQVALKAITEPFCDVCGKPFDPLAHNAPLCAGCRRERRHPAPPFRALRSLYFFDGPIRQAIYRFKYQGKTAQAEPLAALLYAYLSRPDEGAPRIPIERVSLIVPVPLHAWRQYRRGYNQSALLANELAKQITAAGLSRPTVPEVLRRIRNTPPQVGLRAKERAANLHGAIVVDEAMLNRVTPGQDAVLLIDDVCTTQATIYECARVLVRAGWREVYAMTLARQPAGSEYRGAPSGVTSDRDITP